MVNQIALFFLPVPLILFLFGSSTVSWKIAHCMKQMLKLKVAGAGSILCQTVVVVGYKFIICKNEKPGVRVSCRNSLGYPECDLLVIRKLIHRKLICHFAYPTWL